MVALLNLNRQLSLSRLVSWDRP